MAKEKIFRFYINKDDKELLDSVAKQESVSTSEYVRTAAINKAKRDARKLKDEK